MEEADRYGPMEASTKATGSTTQLMAMADSFTPMVTCIDTHYLFAPSNLPPKHRYEGQWKNDMTHGTGKYRHYDGGATYEGDWFEDKRHGIGVETWQDGSRFKGSYVMGKKQGRGKFEWYDGGKYEGQLLDNCI